MKRADIQRLLEAVPESELPTIGSFISFVIDQSQKDPMEKFLDAAPYDDEMSPEEIAAAVEARREALEANEWISAEEIKAEFGLS